MMLNHFYVFPYPNTPNFIRHTFLDASLYLFSFFKGNEINFNIPNLWPQYILKTTLNNQLNNNNIAPPPENSPTPRSPNFLVGPDTHFYQYKLKFAPVYIVSQIKHYLLDTIVKDLRRLRC